MRWLGFDWGEHLYFASDYFEQLYEWAVHLIRAGKAYVDDLSADEIREHRGTLTEPGRNSPWRDRPVEESLDLFERMRKGEFPNGARVLRARIDMASPNINLRDPVLYRIVHAAHPRTGDAWCVYPTYDFAHGQSDAIEGITHSICTPRVRGPPAPLRLAHREPARAVAPPPDTSSRGSTSPTPSSPSASSCAWSTRGTCAAGTIRGCPRSRACAGAASRPRASATSRP